ncbi:ATP synthase F0 subunit C [Candidatus Gracilibacteria bacterium]|nr:ATP synthase F0 subunit C [Candidatus Gracilibacteria bacterium]
MEISAISLGAALAVGLSGLGVALGEGGVARTSLEMIGKSPRLSGTMMIYTVLGIALVETSVIYGLVIAFSIIGSPEAAQANVVGAGLVMGLTGLGAGFAQGKLLSGALEAINRNPDNKTQILQFMVLFAALVETASIYGLTIALQLLSV